MKKLIFLILLYGALDELYGQDSIRIFTSPIRFSWNSPFQYLRLEDPKKEIIRVVNYEGSDSIFEILFSKIKGQKTLRITFGNRGFVSNAYFKENKTKYIRQYSFHPNGSIHSQRFKSNDTLVLIEYDDLGNRTYLYKSKFDTITNSDMKSGREIFYHSNGRIKLIKHFNSFENDDCKGDQMAYPLGWDSLVLKSPFYTKLDSTGALISKCELTNNSKERQYTQVLKKDIIISGRLSYNKIENCHFWVPIGIWRVQNTRTERIVKEINFD